jgi:hypothetical protein
MIYARRLSIVVCMPLLMMLERWGWNELLFWVGLPPLPGHLAPPVGEFLLGILVNYQVFFGRWWRVWPLKSLNGKL